MRRLPHSDFDFSDFFNAPMSAMISFFDIGPALGAGTRRLKHAVMSEGTGERLTLSLPEVTQPVSVRRLKTLTVASILFSILDLSLEVVNLLLVSCELICV